MQATLTSWNNPAVNNGNLLNQRQFEYNDFGQLVTEFQSHDDAVNPSTTPQVQYTYADGSDNTIRPTGLVYPNGRELTYAYGTAAGIDDLASRIASLVDDDTTHLCDYAYLGRQTFVEQDDTEPQLKWTLVDLAGTNDPDTGDIYSGLDRFGRVKDNRWYNDDAAEDVDRIQYGYDRAGNRVWRKNVVAESLGKKFDELYGYDALHRLKDLDRGTLTTLKNAINDPQFAECWSLDATGNWAGYKQSDDGTGWSLEQSRSANEVNEITGISETTGPSWVTPAYSRAGNMTTMPQPNDPDSSYTATYDAWNRLVQIADGADIVSEYAYDGAKRRIEQLSYEEGVLGETRHLYYTEPSKWQVLEERVGTSPDAVDAERQFVWGLRYVDGLILRDQDTGASGILDQRLYSCQDANWNITTLTNANGSVDQRYVYSAYGRPTELNSAFALTTLSRYWEYLYCGYRFDSHTSLASARRRLYSSAIGMWIQRDPLYSHQMTHLYEYCSSTPLTAIDPSGTSGLGTSIATFCSTVNQQPLADILACLCAVVNLIDAFWSAIPGAQAFPVVTAFINIMDCACDLMAPVVQYCANPCASSGQVASTLGTALFGAMFGCLADILSIFNAIDFLTQWEQVLAQLLIFGVSEFFAELGAGSGTRGCLNLLGIA